MATRHEPEQFRVQTVVTGSHSSVPESTLVGNRTHNASSEVPASLGSSTPQASESGDHDNYDPAYMVLVGKSPGVYDSV